MFVVCRLFFRFVFASILITFWLDVRNILGGFGKSKSVILGIDFWIIFACRSKSGPRAAKSGPRAPESRPRAAQELPRAAKSSSRAARERPKSAHERPGEASRTVSGQF